MLIGEYAIQDQELLAQRMLMTRKRTIRRIANDAGSASNLVADPVEHDPVDTMLG